MKKALFTALGAVALFVTAPSFAQDPPPTGIGYIPGMPVPQTTPAVISFRFNTMRSGASFGQRR